MCLAIPGRVLSIEMENEICIGRVQFSGVVQAVALDFVPEVVVGDYVMVHVGFAISRVDENEAEATLHALEQMGLLEGELPPGDTAEHLQECT